MSVLEINPNRAGAPRGEDLRSWSIVCAAGRWFLGRIEGQTEAGLALLADPFSYESQVTVDPNSRSISIRRRCLPVELLSGVRELALLPQVVIPLERCTAGELAELARYVGEAWAGREHIATATAAVKVVQPGTVCDLNGKPIA